MSAGPVCPCETGPYVGEPEIAPGLAHLPRQRGRFGDFRRALLAHARTAPSGALADWPADDGKDLGLLLIEMWAYLLDILAFYDKEIAQESYLGTARRTDSAAALVELIGYLPRPATAASVRVALRAASSDPVVVPKGAALRSEAFGEEKPQVFEVAQATTIHPAHNRWTLAPVVPEGFEDILWLGADAARPAVGDAVALSIGGDLAHAGRLTGIAETNGPDGRTYLRPTIDPAPVIPPETPVASIALLSFAQTAGQTSFTLPEGTAVASGTHVILDALYPQIAEDDRILVETADGGLHPATVTSTTLALARIYESETPTVPLTRVDWRHDAGGTARRLHLRPFRLGQATNPVRTRLETEALQGPRELLEVLEGFSADRPAPASLMVRGAESRAFEAGASVEVAARTGTATVTLDAAPAEADLKTPVRLFANLVTATRGETVPREVLGSGDATVAFQTFTTRKGPLTFLPSATDPAGVAPALEVRVDGVLWSRVPTLLNAGPEDAVYTLRTDAAGKAIVGFGDGLTGMRVPSGVDNVVAAYRHGAGAAKPPAGKVAAVDKAIPGVDGIAWSLAATGGSEAETAADIRWAAPDSALTFGRVVSLRDYEAVARSYAGVTNAAAGWAPDPRSQRAAVRIWTISDGGAVAAELADHLRALGDPDVAVVVTPAQAIPTGLSAEIAVDPAYRPADVREAVLFTLADPQTGVLAPGNQAIGRGLFRSTISAAIQAVPGVASVRALHLSGPSQVDAGLKCGQGAYRAFAPVEVRVVS